MNSENLFNCFLNVNHTEIEICEILVVKYLSKLYCDCVVWNNLDGIHDVNIEFDWIHLEKNYPQMIWLKYDALNENQTNVDDLIRMGIDNGCQVK